jgi:hypothetical protein
MSGIYAFPSGVAPLFEMIIPVSRVLRLEIAFRSNAWVVPTTAYELSVMPLIHPDQIVSGIADVRATR